MKVPDVTQEFRALRGVDINKKKDLKVDEERKEPVLPPVKSYIVPGSVSKKGSNLSLDSYLTDSQEFDATESEYFLQAEILINAIADGSYTVGRLVPEQKKLIFHYLSKFSPVVSRILDLHTKLPLSTLRLEKPRHDVDIVQDYIYEYFDNIMKSSDFITELKKVIQSRWVFGEGVARIEDDFEFTKDMVPSDLGDMTLPEISEKDQDFADKINSQYNVDPDSVSGEEKSDVLKIYIQDVNPDYKGILNFRHIPYMRILNINVNEDLDYRVYSCPKSNFVLKYCAEHPGEEGEKVLRKMGYSQGFINLNQESQSSTLEIDTDPLNDSGVYATALMTEGQSSVDNSLLNGIMEAAIQNLAATRSSNTLVNLSSKIDRIITAPGCSRAQLEVLTQDLTTMALSKEGSMIAVNYDVDVKEISLDYKDRLDLEDTILRTQRDILSGLGMPEDLYSGEGSYGGGFLKVELLTTEYLEFRNSLKDFIENKIFKPLAIKKGFLGVNKWGDVVPIYPTVRFDKFSISRQSEDLALMESLVEKGRLPVESLLDHLGYNSEDVRQKLSIQQTSIFNTDIQAMVGFALEQARLKILGDPIFLTKVLESLNLDPNVVDLEEIPLEDRITNSNRSSHTNP